MKQRDSLAWSRVVDVAHCFKCIGASRATTTSLCGTHLSYYTLFVTREETGVPECFTCRQLALTFILMADYMEVPNG